MAYLLSSLGVSMLALPGTRPMHGYQVVQPLIARRADRFPQSAVALDEVDILVPDAAAYAVGARRAALESRATEISTLRDAATPAGYLVASGNLPATPHAELYWLHGFAGSIRSGRPRRQRKHEVGT